MDPLSMLGMGGAGGSATGQPGGGPLGMMGMDFGMYKIPLIGRFFTNPNEVHKQTQMSKAGQAYSAMRPEMAQARMNALNSQLSAYQGANDILAAMNGGKSQGSGAISYQPLSPTSFMQGSSKVPPATGAAGQGILGPEGLGGGLPGMGGGLPGMGGGMPGGQDLLGGLMMGNMMNGGIGMPGMGGMGGF